MNLLYRWGGKGSHALDLHVAVRFWTRARFKGLLALKRKLNQTRVPIETKESMRWLENMRTSTSCSTRMGPSVISGPERRRVWTDQQKREWSLRFHDPYRSA